MSDQAGELARMRDRMHGFGNSLMVLSGKLTEHVAVCAERDRNSERRVGRIEAISWGMLFSSIGSLVAALAFLVWQFMLIRGGH